MSVGLFLAIITYGVVIFFTASAFINWLFDDEDEKENGGHNSNNHDSSSYI